MTIKVKLTTGSNYIFLFMLFLLTGNAVCQQSNYLDLEASIHRALEANNQLRAGHFAFKKAQWDQKQAWTQLLPTLSFSSSFTRIDDRTFAERDFRRFLPPELSSQIPQTVFQESYYSSLDVSMPLFNGVVLNGVRIARENKSMARAMKESTRQNIVFLVVSSYLNVLKSEEILQLQREYENLTRLNYEKAERMHNAGRYSGAEALRWKVEYQKQKGVVVNSESGLRGARMDLMRLLNLDLMENISLEKQLPEKILSGSQKLQAMPETDILQLVDLKENELVSANAALKAAEKDSRISKLLYRNSLAAYLPNVSVSYSHAWRENNTLALDDYSPTTLRVNFSVPIFTSFKNYTSAKSEYYGYLRSKEQFQEQIRNTRYILTQTANAIINLSSQIDISKTSVEYSKRNYRVVEEQRSQGILSNIEFIDAKLSLQNSRLDEISNHYDFISAMVELYYLLGRLDELIEMERGK